MQVHHDAHMYFDQAPGRIPGHIVTHVLESRQIHKAELVINHTAMQNECVSASNQTWASDACLTLVHTTRGPCSSTCAHLV